MSSSFQVLRGIAIALNVLMAAYQLWMFTLVLTTERNVVSHLLSVYGLMILGATMAPILAVIALIGVPTVLRK
jgi:hypothetical protein